MLYQIGDNVKLTEGLRLFFGEEGPHLILGRKENQYIILSQKGWALLEADRAQYGIDKKYLKCLVWLIDGTQIAEIVDLEPGAKCGTCGVVCPWGKADLLGAYLCGSCRARPKAAYHWALN